MPHSPLHNDLYHYMWRNAGLIQPLVTGHCYYHPGGVTIGTMRPVACSKVSYKHQAYQHKLKLNYP